MAGAKKAEKTLTEKEEQKLALQANQEANERLHALVIKIISWRSGILDGAVITTDNKVTQSEWNKYKKHIQTISKTDTPDKVKMKIEETRISIESRGGFEF